MGHYAPYPIPTPLRHGGLGADVSGYGGLVYIANGAVGQVVIGPGLSFNTITGILDTSGSSAGTTEVSVNGSSVGIRPEINFIAGAGTNISGVDNSVDARVDVTITSTGSAPTNVNYAQLIRRLETPTGTPNGVTTAFTLSATSTADSAEVYINGEYIPSSAWSISGLTLTFTTPPQVGDEILVDFWPTSPTISAQRIRGETPSGTVNGSNVTFTLANSITAGTDRLWVNGRLLKYTTDYAISGDTITFVVAPQVGSVIRCSYWTAGGNTPIYTVFQEVPTGSVNGVNKTYTFASSPSIGTLHLYQRGRLLSPYLEYSQAGNTVTLVTAPQVGDDLVAYYDVATSGVTTLSVTPTGTINGSNTAFTLPTTPTTIAVYVNSARQYTTAYSVSGTTLTFVTAPQVGDTLLVDITS